MVCGQSSIWSVVGGEFLVLNFRWFLWSMQAVVGGRCFAFLLVGGRFLFLRMVARRCLNQYMVDGLWSVAGRWAVVFYYANPNISLY